MPIPSRTIAVIAPDSGLRESLTFALEVENYRVEAFESWRDDYEKLKSYLCVIVDDHVVRNQPLACDALCRGGVRAIILADGLNPPPCDAIAQILTKPLDGPELLQRVQHFLVDAEA